MAFNCGIFFLELMLFSNIGLKTVTLSITLIEVCLRPIIIILLKLLIINNINSKLVKESSMNQI